MATPHSLLTRKRAHRDLRQPRAKSVFFSDAVWVTTEAEADESDSEEGTTLEKAPMLLDLSQGPPGLYIGILLALAACMGILASVLAQLLPFATLVNFLRRDGDRTTGGDRNSLSSKSSAAHSTPKKRRVKPRKSFSLSHRTVKEVSSPAVTPRGDIHIHIPNVHIHHQHAAYQAHHAHARRRTASSTSAPSKYAIPPPTPPKFSGGGPGLSPRHRTRKSHLRDRGSLSAHSSTRRLSTLVEVSMTEEAELEFEMEDELDASEEGAVCALLEYNDDSEDLFSPTSPSSPSSSFSSPSSPSSSLSSSTSKGRWRRISFSRTSVPRSLAKETCAPVAVPVQTTTCKLRAKKPFALKLTSKFGRSATTNALS